MSLQRVTAAPAAPDIWATAGDRCFACGEPLAAGDLAVTWMPNDNSAGNRHWHAEPCAARWAAAFMRDVWEAGHALSAPEPDLTRYDEPDWWAQP